MNEAVKENLIDNMTQNLATLRAKASLSQAKLAEIIGVSRQTLVAVENRKRKMSWSTFLACFLVFSKNPASDVLAGFLISISYLIIYVSAVDKFVLKEETK